MTMQRATALTKDPAPAANSAAWSPLPTNHGARVLQRQCACGGTPGPTGECEACRKKNLQRKADAFARGTEKNLSAPPIVHEVLSSPGQPLDSGTRAFMEPRFAHDFGNVRIHTNGRAAASARAVNALAYTVGRDIVFGAGQFSPGRRTSDELLAHELTHVLQQSQADAPASPLTVGPTDGLCEREASGTARRILNGRAAGRISTTGRQIARQTPSSTDLINPYLDEEPPGAAEAEEFRRATISVVRDPILEALRHNDSISFLNRLRALDPEDRSQLENDAAFMGEIHRALRGMSFWIVQLILRFGNARRLYVRQLSLAVFERNVRQITDLLRTYSELRDPAQVPGVREMLGYEFRADPRRGALLAIMDAPEVHGRSSISARFQEAHYERPRGGGAYQLQSFTGTENFSLARTGSELRVLVRIHLVDAANVSQTFYPDDRTANEWRSGIEHVWNNHFVATNGTTRLHVIFVPLFTEELPNHTVKVYNSEGRSDEHDWYLKSVNGDVIAHEFGHMVGNPDEYRLPGRTADIPASFGLSSAEARRSSVQGVTGTARPTKVGGYTMPGIMGEEYGQIAQPRHVGPIMDLFNNTMLQTGEATFHLE
jgi:Domain of unknown function (DUF4157)